MIYFLGGGFGGKETRNCAYSIPVAIAANKYVTVVPYITFQDINKR